MLLAPRMLQVRLFRSYTKRSVLKKRSSIQCTDTPQHKNLSILLMRKTGGGEEQARRISCRQRRVLQSQWQKLLPTLRGNLTASRCAYQSSPALSPISRLSQNGI